VKKCIGNILENAIRFSSGGVPVDINIYDEYQTVVCEIKDNGKGFAKGDIDRVFELFTTDKEYNDNSIGIGLPISVLIMEALGGSIIIGNNQDGGASVKMLFRSDSKN
jgi:two-component system OmpR family sensor kinase